MISRDLNQQVFQKSPAAPFIEQLLAYKANVQSFASEVSLLIPVGIPGPIKRVVYSPLGPLDRDFDDVRRFQDAAIAGVTRALKAGGRRVLVALGEEQYKFDTADYSLASVVAVLGAYEAVYVVSIYSWNTFLVASNFFLNKLFKTNNHILSHTFRPL